VDALNIIPIVLCPHREVQLPFMTVLTTAWAFRRSLPDYANPSYLDESLGLLVKVRPWLQARNDRL